MLKLGAPQAGALNYRVTALIIAIALFMEQIDATVLATALPTIARDFHAPVVSLSALITSYLLALAIFIPVSGRLADRFGAATILRSAMALFLAASLACAFAPTIGLMTVARFVQGMSGAVMIPVCRLAILRAARKDQIVQAMTWLITPTMLGPILGPPIGGLIVSHLDWRWIFYVNLPVGIIGIVLIGLFIPDNRSPIASRLDLRGFLLSAISLGCLLFGFEDASRPGHELDAVLLIVVGLAAGALYLLHARRTEHPVLDFSLMKDRSFRLSMLAGSFLRITGGAQVFLMPLLFQVGLGMSAAKSGLLVISTAGGAVLSKTVVMRLLGRLGFRRFMIVNGVAVAIAFACCGLFRNSWPEWAIVGVLMLSGAFISFQFSAYNSIAYERMEPERLSAATSFYTTFQQLLLSVGVCTGALSLRVSMAFDKHPAPEPIDFTAAFAVVCSITALATFIHLAFPADAGAGLMRSRR